MNKLVVAIILAAIIMGSSIAMVASNNLDIYGLPLPTLSGVGFLVALVLGFVLVVVSLKSIVR